MESCLVFTCRRDCVLEIWDFGEKPSLPLAKTLAQMWTKKWQSTAVFLPGKPHGRRSLAGYSPWGCRESDTTERLHFSTDGQPKQEDRAWRMSVQCMCLSPALMQGLAQWESLFTNSLLTQSRWIWARPEGNRYLNATDMGTAYVHAVTVITEKPWRWRAGGQASRRRVRVFRRDYRIFGGWFFWFVSSCNFHLKRWLTVVHPEIV